MAGFSECSLSTHITHVFLSVFLDVLWPVGKFTNINTSMFTALHCNNKKVCESYDFVSICFLLLIILPFSIIVALQQVSQRLVHMVHPDG